MIETSQVEKLISENMKADRVTVVDLTGTKDHFRVEVVSSDFSGKTLLEQHRMVQATIQDAIDDGRIHALSIITSSTEQA